MNPYRHFIGEIEGALKAMQAAGELQQDRKRGQIIVCTDGD